MIGALDVLAIAALIIALALFAFFGVMALAQFTRVLTTMIHFAGELQKQTHAASPAAASSYVDEEPDEFVRPSPRIPTTAVGDPYDDDDLTEAIRRERQTLRDTNMNENFDDDPFMRGASGSAR